MYSRLLNPNRKSSFFVFGPRSTGKSTWIQTHFKNAPYIDLLADDTFMDLAARPGRLEQMIAQGQEWVVIDEIQKIPPLLDEVHRLIESRRIKFVLTGSSARKLKKSGANLLAGRALTCFMHPLTHVELGDDFNLEKMLISGGLPLAVKNETPKLFLESYVRTYLKEEVLQEGLTRNLGAFARFLEAASFSQGSTLNVSKVSRECAVERKVVENYFTILEDLLLAAKVPVFTRRAKRKMIIHPKFYYFDAGVYRTVRPKGPLDSPEEIDGLTLETLVYQHLRAYNDYHDLGYAIFYWRTQDDHEVDFILYGEKGLIAIEVKRSRRFDDRDLSSLRLFLKDYPVGRGYVFYGGSRQLHFDGITVLPVEEGVRRLPWILRGEKEEASTGG